MIDHGLQPVKSETGHEPSLWREVFRHNASIKRREIADEVLLVPIRGELAQLQRLFVLNPVGDFIWQQMDGSRDLATIHRHLMEHFEVSDDEARRDLSEFVAGLREAELLVPADRVE